MPDLLKAAMTVYARAACMKRKASVKTLTRTVTVRKMLNAISRMIVKMDMQNQ